MAQNAQEKFIIFIWRDCNVFIEILSWWQFIAEKSFLKSCDNIHLE